MESQEPYRGRRPFRRFFMIGGLFLAVLITATVAIFLFVPGATFDAFLQKKIMAALRDASPEYDVRIAGLHYTFSDNRFDCDSVRILKTDSSVLCNISMLSLSGIDRWQLLWGGGIACEQLTSAHADAKDIVVTFMHSQYELRCARLRVSALDSALVLDILEFHPPMSDSAYFAASKFRRTRFHLLIPEARVTGLACLRLLEGQNYRARTASISDASMSVLINKEKPAEGGLPDPRMPHSLLASIEQTIEIDSIRITNGRLMYSERFNRGAVPAVLTCDSMQIMAQGIRSDGEMGDTVVVASQGILSDGGLLTLRISMPLAQPGENFRYSGHLSSMNANLFNTFVEVSEQKRLKTGVIHSIGFDISVSSGRARGVVRAAYKDLKIVAIDKYSGNEGGVVNKIISFFANNLKLRTTNLPDASGAMKIGHVDYQRKADETFFSFTWIALRSGLCDIVGF